MNFLPFIHYISNLQLYLSCKTYSLHQMLVSGNQVCQRVLYWWHRYRCFSTNVALRSWVGLRTLYSLQMNYITTNTTVLPVLWFPFALYDKYGTVILYDIIQNRIDYVPLYIELLIRQHFSVCFLSLQTSAKNPFGLIKNLISKLWVIIIMIKPYNRKNIHVWKTHILTAACLYWPIGSPHLRHRHFVNQYILRHFHYHVLYEKPCRNIIKNVSKSLVISCNYLLYYVVIYFSIKFIL